MSEIYVVRHGQAAFGHENYDQLTSKGYSQCVSLGEYFKLQGIHFDRVWIGSMRRHRESLEGIFEGLGNSLAFEIHDGFNEFDFRTLLALYNQQILLEKTYDFSKPEVVLPMLRKAMNLWSAGQIELQNQLESWEEFRTRIEQALNEFKNEKGIKTLLVSSGGVISTLIGFALELMPEKIIELNLQCKNSGVTHFYVNSSKLYLSGFNSVAHLESFENKVNITHV